MSGFLVLFKGVKGGAFIREHDNPDRVAKSLRDSMLGRPASTRQLAEARELLCGVIAGLACERATEEDFEALERTLQLIDANQDAIQRADLGTRFFVQIARSTRNDVLAMLVESLGMLVGELVAKSRPQIYPDFMPRRRAILAALRARDKDATAAATAAYFSLVQRHFKNNGEGAALRSR